MSHLQATLRPSEQLDTVKQPSSSTSSIPTPDYTPAESPPNTDGADTAKMDEKTDQAQIPVTDGPQNTANAETAPAVVTETLSAPKPAANGAAATKAKVKTSVTAQTTRLAKKAQKHIKSKKYFSTDGDDSSSSSSSSESDSTSSSSPDDEVAKKKRKAKAKKGKKLRGKKARARKVDTEDSDSDSSDDSSSVEDEDDKATKARKAKKLKKLKAKMKAIKIGGVSDSNSDYDDDSDSSEDPKSKRVKAKKRRKAKRAAKDAAQDAAQAQLDLDLDGTIDPQRRRTGLGSVRVCGLDVVPRLSAKQIKKDAKAAKKAEAKRQKLKGTKLEFVRVDRLWDHEQHAYVTRETREDVDAGEYDEYVFNVRRIFSWENKHISTVVDIKSKPLKAALIKIMGVVKGVSLAEDTPSIDPNMIFLHLEELRAYMNKLKAKVKTQKVRKLAKEITIKRKAIKVLVKYLDKDFDETKKTLYPMLENGTITFDLLWALFKSNEIVFAPTYGAAEVPRAFKVEYATLEKSLVKGQYYEVEGQYVDYNGSIFGKGDCAYSVDQFKGPRKISSLSCYPIRYHRDYDSLREDLIQRGKQFVSLKGMLYKFQKGMAFYKKPNGQVIKVNVDGRVMIDPANFRRINPNYSVSTIKPEDPDLLPVGQDDSEIDSEEEQDTDDETDEAHFDKFAVQKKDIRKTRKKLVKDSDDDELYIIDVDVEEKGNAIQKLDSENIIAEDEFIEEEYLIASPVVLGFSFGHKMWMEFDIAGLKDIQWNEGAFDSLVIPEDQKEVVKALVESHSYSASTNIDDVIQGKGQGLVAVLHGPPGTGKTLTAEGIAELLKKPLYMVSVGELGIKGGDLEKSFGQIIDIAHCWGALLLLDEADVFLERRELHDIGRNALVSIFLRLLEYFQGILFLTTNRVVTFDEAFASRIHIGLRYGELTLQAKKHVWKLFIDKVRKLEGVEVSRFSEEDFSKLSNYQLNGREIKNSVRTAQSLATIDKKPLSMEHLLKVLFVGNVFAKDLKGPGYEEALKFYM